MNIDFLPETPPETRSIIENIAGSWWLEGLEPSPETLRDMEVADLVGMAHTEAIEHTMQRILGKKD